jgi:hypothetical protein
VRDAKSQRNTGLAILSPIRRGPILKIAVRDSAELLTRHLFRNNFGSRAKSPIDQFKDETIMFRIVESSTRRDSKQTRF